MSTVNNIELKVNLRKNNNEKSDQFGKYYAELERKRTLSLKGLAKHIADHGSIFTRDVIEGVLCKLTQCVPELLSQGVPVKLDGLGTFVPTVESVKMGITKTDILAGKWNASNYVKAIHIRFRPEGTSDDDITSRNFKDQCVLSTYGVEEKVDLTPEESDPKKKQFIKRITPLDDWIAQQKSASGSGSGSSQSSGENTNTGEDEGNTPPPEGGGFGG